MSNSRIPELLLLTELSPCGSRVETAQPSPTLDMQNLLPVTSYGRDNKLIARNVTLFSTGMNIHELCKSGNAESLIAYFEQISAQSPDDLNFVIDLKNEQRYTPLHASIFAK